MKSNLKEEMLRLKLLLMNLMLILCWEMNGILRDWMVEKLMLRACKCCCLEEVGDVIELEEEMKMMLKKTKKRFLVFLWRAMEVVFEKDLHDEVVERVRECGDEEDGVGGWEEGRWRDREPHMKLTFGIQVEPQNVSSTESVVALPSLVCVPTFPFAISTQQ